MNRYRSVPNILSQTAKPRKRVAVTSKNAKSNKPRKARKKTGKKPAKINGAYDFGMTADPDSNNETQVDADQLLIQEMLREKGQLELAQLYDNDRNSSPRGAFS